MPVEIEAPDFLSRPPYRIRGTLRRSGLLVWEYDHSPIKGRGRTVSKNVAWSALREELDIEGSKKTEFPKSGPFNFEIRAWDIGREDITEIAARFDLQRASIRRSIKAFKGISLYRDGILVLPKSDTARDWLGLDSSRSRVGIRLSTSQIVGYVSITADANPAIDDTSDRERLVNNPTVTEFEAIIKHIIELLETQRDRDREANDPSRRSRIYSQISHQKNCCPILPIESLMRADRQVMRYRSLMTSAEKSKSLAGNYSSALSFIAG